MKPHTNNQREFGSFFSVLMALMLTGSAALAAPLTSTQIAVSPSTVNTGQTVTLQSSIKASERVQDVAVTLQIHRVSANGELNPYAVYSKTLTDQDFAANQTKSYRENYVVSAALISSDYAFVVKATSADQSQTYLPMEQNTPSQKFAVKGRPDVGFLRGVNIMDLGISSQNLPGTYNKHYTKPGLRSLQHLKERGLEVVRIPFKWERLQPVLGAEFDAAYLGYLMQVLRDSNTAGLKVIVDMHNFGRYTPTQTDDRTAYALGDPRGATPAHFADVWKRLSTAIRADKEAYEAVYAYDLMNEPYNLVPGAPTDYASSPISSFENGVEGWAAHWPTTTALAKVTRNNQGALEVRGAPAAGGESVFRIALPAGTKAVKAASGSNLRFKGFVPASTSGDVRARIWMLNAKGEATASEPVALVKGQEFTVDFAPPAAVWENNRGIYLDFLVNNSDGFAPSVFLIDEVNQGTFSGGKSPQKVWEEYSQAAVTGIRSLNDPMLIHVEGYDFSSAIRWPINHPKAWIQDPLNKIMYHAHQYMDDDSSGAYKLPHSEELKLARKQGHDSVGARAIARYKHFTDWLAEQNAVGFIGEIGWPNSHVVSAEEAAAWDADAHKLFDFMDTMNLGATVWSTGSWLPPTGNRLNTYVLPEAGKQFLPLSPALVLEKHPGNKK